MTIDLNEAVTVHAQTVRGVSSRLSSLAGAMSRLGMADAAKEIDTAMDDLLTTLDLVKAAYGESLRENLRDAQQGTMNIMHAVLAGIKVGAKEPRS